MTGNDTAQGRLLVTTVPLKEPFRIRAYLYLGDRQLASVRCRLTPADAPTQGVALVPDARNWLALGSLTLLVQRSGRQYTIFPTRLERAAGVPNLLTFDIGQ